MNPTNTTSGLSDNFLESLGLSDLPKEERDRVAEEAVGAIFENVLIRLSAILPKEQAAEFEKLFEAKPLDPHAIVAFMTKVPNIAQLVQEEVGRFRAIGEKVQ